MGRPRKTTSRTFLDVALRIVDAEGLDALTLRRLGTEIGVSSTALYTYFVDRQDLIEKLAGSILGDVISTVDIDPDSPPRRRLVDLAVAVRAGLAKHPRALPAFVEIGRQVPDTDTAIAGVIATLVEAGIADDDIPIVYRAYESFIFGTTVFDLGGAPIHHEIRRQRYRQFEHPSFRPLSRSKRAVAESNDEAFRRGIEHLLAGFGV